ncbi:mcm2 3 5 family protein [Colletotrichum scovillei]|uniref:Mcm2 3 5 family protein n=1 Tax=Colletotrichum scovillei TaxID=1209932 RepID=A0A9P7UGE0_9PEZI|nr:mcm2 3 5 family protein [Colletotrichum scovillei]KAG7074909.1 mcm2 3 5 family protein [Colletotrichum scovillei]KAG7082046.1 mcm2 3 5 family protein [Colletotrichum scovillei]
MSTGSEEPAQPANLRSEPCIPRAQPLITAPLLSVVPRVSRQVLLGILATPRPVVSLFEKVVIRTARVPNPPRHNQIPLHRPATAAALELLARRRVDSQRKQILRLSKVRHQAGPGEEVGEADDVDDEDESEDEVEALLPLGAVARRVLLRADRGVEGV